MEEEEQEVKEEEDKEEDRGEDKQYGITPPPDECSFSDLFIDNHTNRAAPVSL